MASAPVPELVVRPIGPADRTLLLEGFERLSDRTRYLRFFTPLPELPPGELRFLTEPDGIDHYALGAAVRRRDGSLRGLGVARYVRAHDDPRVGHATVTVVDDAQRHGLGSHLLRGLAYAAGLRGIDRFRFTVLPENRPVRKLLTSQRVPLLVRNGLLVGEASVVRVARIPTPERWQPLLEREAG
jgi:GNAT superfamily N-acetyltransferase